MSGYSSKSPRLEGSLRKVTRSIGCGFVIENVEHVVDRIHDEVA